MRFEKNMMTLQNDDNFYQSEEYNKVNPGFRNFSQIDNSFFDIPMISEYIFYYGSFFAKKLGVEILEVYAHQVRVIGSTREEGQPTPEGIHKDGADYSMQVLFNRKNCVGGVSRIYNNNKEMISSLQSVSPLDFYLRIQIFTMKLQEFILQHHN